MDKALRVILIVFYLLTFTVVYGSQETYTEVLLQELTIKDNTFKHDFLDEIVDIKNNCPFSFSYQIIVKCYKVKQGKEENYILLFEPLDDFTSLMDKTVGLLNYYFIYKGVMFALLETDFPTWIFSIGNKIRTLTINKRTLVLDVPPLRYSIYCSTKIHEDGTITPLYHLIENRCTVNEYE